MESNQKFSYTLKEVTEALIKKQDLHEGIWGLFVEFGIGGAVTGPTPENIFPTAIVPITKIGIEQTSKESSIALDAAKVNPLLASPTSRSLK